MRATRVRSQRLSLEAISLRLPPPAFFISAATFHYLGPSLAVLLFAEVAPLGVAWLRIVSAALVLCLWRRPWRLVVTLDRRQLVLLVALAVVLAVMNGCFYLAIARLPLSTVGAIEFLGPIALATLGTRTTRNWLALLLAVAGAAVLLQVRVEDHPLGFAFAFANCSLFAAYVVLGHRTAEDGGAAGVDRLALALLLAVPVITLLGLPRALPALGQWRLLVAGVGVGVCSSVIPYVLDQLAMARLPRSTFALMLTLLPACATVMGLLVLHQVPRPQDLAGVLLVIVGLALHRD
ncbi:MAG: EamA family transporter [Candidatus Dormibacteria bacterium]